MVVSRVKQGQRLELRQIRRNYMTAVWGYTALSALMAWIIYSFTKDQRAVNWFITMLAISLICTATYRLKRDSLSDTPEKIIRITLAFLVVHSVTFAYILFIFIPEGSPEMVMLLTIITISLAAGVMALTASFIRAFFASAYPSMSILSVSLFLHDDAIYQWLSLSVLLILLALTWFSRALSQTIRRSSELGQQNKSLIRELRSALIQTDEANRAKSVFLASASHDLRQPLHALGLLTETLGGTNMQPQQSEIHQLMMSAIDSTRGMLDSLLNISKLDAGAISAQPKPFLVQSVLKKLEAELAPTADEHKLIYRSRDTIVAAHSDPVIVELILRNLIANAIRYTHEGGLLVACRSQKSSRLVVEVWDTGVGIPEINQGEIFSEFQQLDNPERDSQKGFGLGLAIAQGLAATINTKITLESTVDQGSVFRFELPASNAKVIEDIPDNINPINFSGQSVLVVDDDASVRASMQSLMQSWGCICSSAENAKDGIAALGENDLDILLVDYRLRDGQTGRDAIDQIRKHFARQVPAIIITGDTSTERIKEAQAVDALLLHKPASTRQLQRMMRKLLD